MRDVAELFDSIGVTWWADYGTLLGAVRNPRTTWADYPWLRQDGRETTGPAPGIIPHDKDADIGVLQADWIKVHRALAKLRRQDGYEIPVNYQRGSMKVRLSRFNHTNCDVFFWSRRTNDRTMYRKGYAQVDRFKGKEFHEDLLFPLSTVEWEGLTLPAPRDPEAFLAMRYGPNWMTPVMANNDGILRD